MYLIAKSVEQLTLAHPPSSTHTHLSPQVSTISLMSRAVWNSTCDAILVDVLLRQRADGMQTSNGNWHSTAWTVAQDTLAGTELHSGGVVKVSTSCQNRWAAVCNLFYSYSVRYLTLVV